MGDFETVVHAPEGGGRGSYSMAPFCPYLSHAVLLTQSAL